MHATVEDAPTPLESSLDAHEGLRPIPVPPVDKKENNTTWKSRNYSAIVNQGDPWPPNQRRPSPFLEPHIAEATTYLSSFLD
jgi:hypothetical protein